MVFSNLPKKLLRRKKLKFKQGISYVELLITLVIASLISMSIFGIYFAHYRIFTNQNALIDAETQNKNALTLIGNQIRIANTFFDWFSDDKTLALGVWSLNAAGEPYDSGHYDYIYFYEDPSNQNNLLYEVEANSQYSTRTSLIKIISTNLSSLEFKYYLDGSLLNIDNGDYLDANEIEIILTTQSTTIYGKTYTSTQSSKTPIKNL